MKDSKKYENAIRVFKFEIDKKSEFYGKSRHASVKDNNNTNTILKFSDH